MTIGNERSIGGNGGGEPVPSRVTLPDELSVSTVAEVRPVLDRVLDGAFMDVEIDAGDVGQLDAAGLQMVVAFMGAVDGVGARARIVAASDVFMGACLETGWHSVVSDYEPAEGSIPGG